MHKTISQGGKRESTNKKQSHGPRSSNKV